MALVKVSVLSLVSGISGVVVVDGEIPAHAGIIASTMDKTIRAGRCRLVLSSRESVITAKQYKCAVGRRVQRGLDSHLARMTVVATILPGRNDYDDIQ